jgi:hypothetical protein
MVTVDLIGLAATICLIGIRYPHYVIMAACIHELGSILITLFVHGQINTIVAAGAFSTMTVSNNIGITGILLIFSGSLSNYIVSVLAGGIAFEPTSHLLSSWATLRFPLAVINFRLCILSFFISIWKIII